MYWSIIPCTIIKENYYKFGYVLKVVKILMDTLSLISNIKISDVIWPLFVTVKLSQYWQKCFCWNSIASPMGSLINEILNAQNVR